MAHPQNSAAPWYVTAAIRYGRPTALLVALLMCAPGEIHLAALAGWSSTWSYGAPATMSLYALIGAIIADQLPAGDPKRSSARLGAGLALLLAMSAQVVDHLISAHYLPARSIALIAVVSAVPPLAAWHIISIAARPAADATAGVAVQQPLSQQVNRTPKHWAVAKQAFAQKDRALASIYAAADYEGISVSTIRSRVARGGLTRHGTDHRGRVLVDIAELTPNPRI
ncbi:hypothetical protein [Streptacidiphilus albus]|uniref:hypothetical protein n=1 Tax=Streptacidiphilus albus TaxID=105425 RepID=UPI00068DA434|nr:hypothetical protein [Streptacidiphilus albus]